MSKVFFCQDGTDVGLGIDEIDRCLLEAVTAFVSDIAGVPSVRTVIGRNKVILRVAEGSQDHGFFLAERSNLFF